MEDKFKNLPLRSGVGIVVLNKDDKSRLSWEKIFSHEWFLSYNSNELLLQKKKYL